MKTTLRVFDNYNSLKPKIREFALPEIVVINELFFQSLLQFADSLIDLDIDSLYHNKWANKKLQLIIPDFARVGNHRHGYYLEQTEDMINIRDSTLKCGYCNKQYQQPCNPFCLECLFLSDVPEECLHMLYLRPVSTFDIELNPKSIYIPKWVKERHNKIPEFQNGKMINV